MKTYVHEFQDISCENFVILVKNIQDVQKWKNIFVSQEIYNHIEFLLQEKKSCLFDVFIGKNQCKKIYFFIDIEDQSENSILFYGKHFPSLPENICLFLSGQEDLDFFETCELSRYHYQEYKSEKTARHTQIFCKKEEVTFFETSQRKIQNIFLARDLGNMPSNILTPKKFAEIIKKTKFSKQVKIHIFDSKEIKKQQLGLIEAVGKGSENTPYFVILERIIDKNNPVTAFVGKGVTFDTGGIQVKPKDMMYEMKADMGGAAVLLGLMKQLDDTDSQKNYVAAFCLAENVISGNSYKPSDILVSYSGKTVEIIHTDAEGRLVLADGISYVSKNYNCERIVSIATLTGACLHALGYRYAGIMGTDRESILKLQEYSEIHTEKYVQLPFSSYFIEKTKSEIADLKNLSPSVYAGSSMGAAFLYNFLEKNEKFLHIDIAGTYINESEAYGKMPKGSTGFGVESLAQLFY